MRGGGRRQAQTIEGRKESDGGVFVNHFVHWWCGRRFFFSFLGDNNPQIVHRPNNNPVTSKLTTHWLPCHGRLSTIYGMLSSFLSRSVCGDPQPSYLAPN